MPPQSSSSLLPRIFASSSLPTTSLSCRSKSNPPLLACTILMVLALLHLSSSLTRNTVNPKYLLWNRQDQILLSAIFGSCSNVIQPIISSAEAWQCLSLSYANSSSSCIISLKAKLTQNPKGSRSIAHFLMEMRSIADELTLTQNPVNKEDLIVHIITQLEEEYSPLVVAIKVRNSSITYSESSTNL
ncbi:hypothetical protein L6164_025054 [Bauhinia variegata]|uniref:Uncharacterized protein n=1 Tax=Bauhinia variegata TaxID=167791 RepID=A0ACB9M0S0_BAUVA|nr:hypothetical protein L6164_025054 [Bauhinia variegata]